MIKLNFYRYISETIYIEGIDIWLSLGETTTVIIVTKVHYTLYLFYSSQSLIENYLLSNDNQLSVSFLYPVMIMYRRVLAIYC